MSTTQNSQDLAEASGVIPLDSIIAPTLDIPAQRAAQVIEEGAWAKQHPLSSVGYQSREIEVLVRDGAAVTVKVTWPDTESGSEAQSISLPVLIITHGGGFIQGTHITEERWLLWPLFQRFKFVSISIAYRLAPEYPFPTWIDDSMDMLHRVFKEPASFLAGSNVKLDLENVILAGSSAGAGISAALAQECRDQNIKIRGVILNVPVLCDYRHLPQEQLRKLNKEGILSYEECSGSLMKAVWDLVIPSTTGGSNLKASPLLGDCSRLPEHLIFVAEQDPLRDEGRYYADKLSQAGVPVSLTVYPDVSHVFAESHDLQSTQNFWKDLQRGFERLISA